MPSNQEILNEDLTMCDQEPIHEIGNIQPHGYLLAVSKSNYTVAYATENCNELFGIDTILGASIQDLDETLISDITGGTLTEVLNVKTRINDYGSYNPYKVTIGNQDWNAVTHSSGDYIVIELEPPASESSALHTQVLLGEIMMQMNLAGSDLNALMQIVARQMRKLLEYDRIMIYKFWDDWHGEVIAEAKGEDMEPFLGLHYPASDIPRQARELYTKNLTRLIADVNAIPIPIKTKISQPLDLTYSQLRAVSPVHIEYLKNMEVGASYSISLLHKGKLWGLIACHHAEAKFLDYDKRKASEIISQYLGNVIDLKTRESKDSSQNRYLKSVEELEQQMRDDWSISKGLFAHPDNFLKVTNGTGGAIAMNDQLQLFGKTPEKEEVEKLIDWLAINNNDRVFYTTNLSKFIPDGEKISNHASGIIAITISREMKEYLLWFKPEQVVTVNWAGKNEKEEIKGEDGKVRLSPRKSFQKWVSEVRNTSEVWSDEEVRSVKMLRDKIMALIQLKANEVRRLNEKLNQAYDDLDSFSYTLSHDLKTPLNTIRGYIELFIEEQEEEHPLFQRILKNTDLMYEMISNILHYSKLSREQFQFEEVAVLPLLEEIKAQMLASKKFDNIHINVPQKTIVKGNKMMIYQVFLNLIENGIKYQDDNDEPRVDVEVEEDQGFLKFSVRDNGMGIEEQNFDKIFGLFKRIPTEKDIEGSGVGLAIVKRIVEKHQGIISVESVPGKGTTFYVSLKK